MSIVSADGWASGDNLFEPLTPPAPPPRPHETRCPACGVHLLHYEPPLPGERPPCSDCERRGS